MDMINLSWEFGIELLEPGSSLSLHDTIASCSRGIGRHEQGGKVSCVMTRLERSQLFGHSNDWLNSYRDLVPKIEVDLTAIECLAPYAFILERDEMGPPIYSHIGCAVPDVIGSDPRGKIFYDYWSEDARQKLESYFNGSAENNLAFRLLAIAQMSKNLTVEVETTLIPVTAADAGKRQFVGISLARHGLSTKAGLSSRLQQLQNAAFVHDEPRGRCSHRAHSNHR
jgi:hypothetical protein